MDNWAGWPPNWPHEERVLELRQTCRRCGRDLQGTVGRRVPGVGWLHRECAIAVAVERAATEVIYLLNEDDLEDEEV